MTRRGAAGRYARALFDVAHKEGADVQQVGRELSALAAVMSGHEMLARTLSNPAIPAPRKRAVMEQILTRAGAVSLPLTKLLLLLADRDRLVLVPEVAAAYDARLMEHAQVVRAEVTTAIPLTDAHVAELRDGLARVTGRQVQLETRIDASIIGGAVARIGSTVYDGSVVTQLQKVQERLTAAAAE